MTDDDSWAALAALLGGTAGDARFATLTGRLEQHDELDALIEAWTSTRTAPDAAAELQAVGVAACEVFDNAGLLADPHVQARQWFQFQPSSRFPEGDAFSGHPIRLGTDPGRWWRAGPSMGEDTRHVLETWAGLAPAEIDSLLASGAAFTAAVPEQSLRRPYTDEAAARGLPRAGGFVSAGPWAGLRVLELSGLTGAYASRMWAALGADVVVAEPDDGHLLRRLPPFAPGHEGSAEGSLWWAYFGQGKRSVIAPPGSAARAELLAAADVVLTDVDPATDEPAAAHDTQVVVAISPFGLHGPRRGWKGSELVAWASSGIGTTIGFPERAPVCPATPVQFAAHLASMFAVNAAMLARRAVRTTGRGQVVDLSMQECCLALAPETGAALFLDDGLHRSRPGNRRAVTRPWGLYPCTDGFVSFLVLQPAHWRAMAIWLAEATGIDGVLDEVFVDLHVRWEVSDFIDDCTEQLTTSRSKLELFIEGQRRGIPITPVNTIADLRQDPHLAASGFWRTDDHPIHGALPSAGRAVPGRPRLVALGQRPGPRRPHRLQLTHHAERATDPLRHGLSDPPHVARSPTVPSGARHGAEPRAAVSRYRVCGGVRGRCRCGGKWGEMVDVGGLWGAEWGTAGTARGP